MSIPALVPTDYSITTTLKNTSFQDAVEKVTAALKVEGFGVLTQIDVQATLKKKLDADTRPYLILGACNPTLAYETLQAEPAVGVLLPCNVVVSTNDGGDIVVAAVNPVAMFGVVNRPDVAPLAQDVYDRLARVIASLEA